MLKSNFSTYVWMHIGLLIYSIGLVFSKYAARYSWLTIQFLMCILLMTVFLLGFALIWQQILKKIPLSTALLNAEVCLIWTSLFGAFLFKEALSLKLFAGIGLILAGVSLVNRSEST